MATIPGITESSTQKPSFIDGLNFLTKANIQNEKGQELIRDISTILGAAVRVTTDPVGGQTKETGTPTGATGVPSLDDPGDLKAIQANLEALLAYLKLENDEKQSELAKGRIETQKSKLEKTHNERKEKLAESLKEMDKAAKSSLLTKIFGWVMAALAVAFAVASCVATGGAAVGAIVGAVMAVGFCIGNEFGAMEKLTEAVADMLKEMGMSDRAAQIVATIAVTVGAIAVTFYGASMGNAIQSTIRAMSGAVTQAVVTATQLTATAVKMGLEGAMLGMGLIAGGAGVGASLDQYNAALAKADVSEMDKFLAIMRQRLEESQEELEQIIRQIQETLSAIVEILDSATDVESEIANQMGMV